MDHEQTMGVNSKVLDRKQQNIFERISLFWSEELQCHPEQLNELSPGKPPQLRWREAHYIFHDKPLITVLPSGGCIALLH